MNEIEIESNTDSDRKLATIQTISELHPIPEADAIEVAKIKGWNVVVKKGEFEVGDKCIYCEIDSILPETEWSEFLRKSNFRIKTVRLRGQISQGICFPISILENYGEVDDYTGTFEQFLIMSYNDEVGMREYDLGEQFSIEDDVDVTNLLKVTKYVPKTFDGDGGFLSGKMKGNFPSFLIKTDETRIQNLKGIVDAYAGTECIVTEKIDGCSATFFYKDGEFGVCSRNREVAEDDINVFWKMVRKYKIEENLRNIGRNIAIQGEIVGPKIQGNKLKLIETDLYVFDIFDIDKYEYLEYYDIWRIAYDMIKLNIVPSIMTDEKVFTLKSDIDEMVQLATRKSNINPDVWCEGIVIRSLKNINDPMLQRKMRSNRISLKVINPEFLLKYDKR